ncbi:hypothetical protein ACVW1K_002650 [Bacillus subtilis]
MSIRPSESFTMTKWIGIRAVSNVCTYLKIELQELLIFQKDNSHIDYSG